MTQNGRYKRQIILPEIGKADRKSCFPPPRLSIGCGGLGSTLLYCLCGMGVGRIGFCDGDVVSLSNLNRQFLHTPADIGRKKSFPRWKSSPRLRPNYVRTLRRVAHE
jgi:molybdopterin/thiamine biosynthesis adenylyltransferase